MRPKSIRRKSSRKLSARPMKSKKQPNRSLSYNKRWSALHKIPTWRRNIYKAQLMLGIANEKRSKRRKDRGWLKNQVLEFVDPLDYYNPITVTRSEINKRFYR